MTLVRVLTAEKYEQITDLKYVQDLQTSGFLEKMWGKKIPPSQ